MAEHPLDDPAARVRPVLTPLGMADLLVEHVDGPPVEAAIDDPERRVDLLAEVAGAQDMLQAIFPRAVERRAREPGGVRARLACEVAEQEHALAERVADRRPGGPAVGGRLHG